MASFDTSGIQELISEMRRMGEAGGEVARAMTLAAAEEIRTVWRKTAEDFGLIDTGAMVDSVTYPNEPTEIGGIFIIDVYPQGTDARGVRNAEKAFILHYGSSRLPPTYWVDEADKRSAEPVRARLESIWSEFLESGKVPTVDIAPAAKGRVTKTRSKTR